MKKKVIFGIIITILVVLIAVLTTILIVKNGNSSSKSKKIEYENLAEDFIIALKSEENMEDFIEKNMDFKGLYAFNSEDLYEAESVEEYNKLFEEVRSDVSEEDLEEMKDMYTGGFKGLVEYGLDLTLKDVNVKNSEEYPNFTMMEATYEEDGEKVSFFFDLYKGKIIMITRGEGLEDLYEDTAYYSGDEDIPVNLSLAEKRKLNKEIDKHFNGENKLSGSEVKALIDSIIKVDEEYIDKDVFVGLYVSTTGKDTWDLVEASEEAKTDRTEKNIKKAIQEMEKAKEAIDENEDYYVLKSLNHGIVLSVSVEPYDESNN